MAEPQAFGTLFHFPVEIETQERSDSASQGSLVQPSLKAGKETSELIHPAVSY